MQIGKFWDEQGIRHVGDAWYRIEWAAPGYAAGSRVFLWFGAVDEQAVVWVNGRKAGEHLESPDIGWDKRFAVEVTDLLRPGTVNLVTVKVTNSALAGGIWKSVRFARAR